MEEARVKSGVDASCLKAIIRILESVICDRKKNTKMSVTITLPDKLANTLQEKAEAQNISLDELVTDL